MAFRGWPADALEFYEGLEVENTKAYWERNRSTFETCVRGPMEALLQELEPEFGTGRIFRPYRDVRFSADKSPYKTALGAVANQDGTVFYVQISATGLFAGSGYYHMARDQLARFRAAIDDDTAGAELTELVGGLEAAGYDIGGETLRTAPRGYTGDHPRIALLRRKGIVVARGWPPARWLGTAKAKDRVAQTWRDSRPLNAWLHTHVGPTSEPGR
jgi:uncharacterized protein (TIGR02453 family)